MGPFFTIPRVEVLLPTRAAYSKHKILYLPIGLNNYNNFVKYFEFSPLTISNSSFPGCSLPMDAGKHCKTHPGYTRTNWYHNGSACVPFEYKACGGNGNNFRSREQCEFHCGPWPARFCEDPAPMLMQCRAYIMPMFKYDASTDECKEFIYGGCGIYQNRFNNIHDCQRMCVQGNHTMPFLK